MAFAPRHAVAQPVRAPSHKKQHRAASSKHSSRRSSRHTSPHKSHRTHTTESHNEKPTTVSTEQYYDYAYITWNNILLLGYDTTHDTTLSYTTLHRYNSIKQYNHLLYYVLCKCRSIQCTLQYNTSDKYKDLLQHLKLCYPIIDVKQQREFTSLCYTIINGFTAVLTELPVGSMRATLFQTPDSKLIPILYYWTSFMLQQSMIQEFAEKSIPQSLIQPTTLNVTEQIQCIETEICTLSQQYIQHCIDADTIQTSIQQRATILTEQYNTAIELHQSLLNEQTELTKLNQCTDINIELLQTVQSTIQQLSEFNTNSQQQYNNLSTQLTDTSYGIDGDTVGRNTKLDELLNNYHVTLKQIERQCNMVLGMGTTLPQAVTTSTTYVQQQSVQSQTLHTLLQQLQNTTQNSKTVPPNTQNASNTTTPIKQLIRHIDTPNQITITPIADYKHKLKPVEHTEQKSNDTEENTEWISADKQIYANDTMDLQQLRISGISHFTNASTRFSLVNGTDVMTDADGLLDD